jgi:putative transposase
MQGLLRRSEYQVSDGIMLTSILESEQLPLLSAIAECQVTNKKTTLIDKSSLCKNDTQKLKSLETSDRASILKEKELKPFWNEQCAANSSRLWLPTETALHGSVVSLSDSSSSTMLDNSWFSAKIHYRRKLNLPKTCSILSMCSPVECTDLGIIKSKLIKLSLTKNQKALIDNWLRVSRFVYNWTMALLRDYEGKKPSWMDIKKMLTRLLPQWTKDTPFQIKGIAIKDAHAAYWATLRANKGSGHFPSFRFRSRKDTEQSVFIPKSAISNKGIYPLITGKGLRFSESLPESIMDSRLVWRAGKYYLSTPFRQQHVPSGDNQARVVSIDPGVRTFATFYSDVSCGEIGSGDFSRIQRLAFHMDDLISRMAKAGKQRKKTMRKALARVQDKIKNLIDELHHKAALFLVTNFDCILLPSFETTQMVGKSGRKIKSKTVRSMLTFAHYRFKQFLKHKAFEHGKAVIDVSEAYTSKTHPQTGEIRNIGSAKRIKLLDGSWIGRDQAGAFNIMLKALVDMPDLLRVAVNES